MGSFRIATVILLVTIAAPAHAQAPARTLDLRTYRDKLAGAWVAELAFGGWGEPSEFTHCGTLVPPAEIAPWTPATVNVDFGPSGDQVSVELPFLEALATRGVFAGWDAFGATFRDMTFDQLFSGNLLAQRNLRQGMPAPSSGYYTNTAGNAENQSWEMESDWTGLVTPGQVNAAIDLNWRAGHVAFYGDGVYGGVMIAAMHAAAFFATSIDEIVDTGRRAVPVGSAYRQMIEDVVGWHAQYPSDWTLAWQQVQARYGGPGGCTLKALTNGANVLLGLLYGGGDPEQSSLITIRAGHDTDCTAQNVGAIVGNWRGLSRIPDRFKAALDPNLYFWRTQWTLNKVLRTTEDLAREALVATGGTISGSGDDEIWSIPAQSAPSPPILETIPVAPNSPPTLAAQVIAVAGRTVSFGASATDADGIAAFEWSFGDLSRADGANVTHTYLQDGYYQVVCWVTDGTGNTTWRRLDVVLGDVSPPIITLEAVDAFAAQSGHIAGKLAVTRVGSSDVDLAIRYALDGTAVNGADYDALSGTVTIKSGFGSENILVWPKATAPGKTVHVTLLDDASYQVAAARAATVTIAASLPAAPPTPSGLQATGGPASVTLAWTGSATATSYSLYRATMPGGEEPTPYRRGITGTSFVDGGLTSGATYYYKVSAVSAVDESGLSAEAAATTLGGAATPLATPTIAPTVTSTIARTAGATPTSTAAPTPSLPIGCAASSTLRQTGTNGDYFRQIASDNSIANSDRQRIKNAAPLAICAVSAYWWNAGPLNGAALTTGRFHLEVWSDQGGVPGVQLGADSTSLDAASLPAAQGQAPLAVVTWPSNPPRPSGDFWLVLQSDSLSNDQLAWSAARYNPTAYETAAYDASKLGVDKGTDFTFTIYVDTSVATPAATASSIATPTPTMSPTATPARTATVARTATPSPTATATSARSATPTTTVARTLTPAATTAATAVPTIAATTTTWSTPSASPSPVCAASSTLRQTGTNGDYFRQIASDNSIANSDRQRIKNAAPLAICAVSAYWWNAGPLNGAALTTGSFHLEVWSDQGGIPGVQLGADSTSLDAASLPAAQGQAPLAVVTWPSNPPRPSGDFWLVLQSDSLSNDQLAWSAARYNPTAYETAAYDAFKLGVDKGTDFTFTIYTLGFQ